MLVDVVIPWRAGCPHRERALEWIIRQHQHPVTLALGGDPWCKAAAVMPAVRASTADVVVVADADCWTDGLADAVQAVRDGAPWAIPHGTVYRLDQVGSIAVLAGRGWESQPLDQLPYGGTRGGGVMVLPRETLLAIPLDTRFTGWGQEDESWAAALLTLTGDGWYGDAALIHFWHPPQPRLTRARGSREGWALRRRYMRARGDPVVMASLIQEAHEHLDADQPDVRDPATLAARIAG